MRVTQGCFSFLPDLTDEQISRKPSGREETGQTGTFAGGAASASRAVLSKREIDMVRERNVGCQIQPAVFDAQSAALARCRSWS